MSSGPDTCNSQWALSLVVIRNKGSFDLFWRIKILDGSIFDIWSDGKFVTEAQRAPKCAIIQSAWKLRCAQCSVHPFVYKTWKLPIVHFVIHSCRKLFLGFSSLANESPFNPDYIGRQPLVALETSYKWRLSRKKPTISRRAISPNATPRQAQPQQEICPPLEVNLAPINVKGTKFATLTWAAMIWAATATKSNWKKQMILWPLGILFSVRHVQIF